jgi:hypothetical protein
MRIYAAVARDQLCADSAAERAVQTARGMAPSISLLRFSPALLLMTAAIADGLRFADVDLWGHLRFGQAMLALHQLVRREPYSYSAAGHVWNNHEWLSELVLAAVYNHGGVAGLIWLKFACAAAVVMFLAAALAETAAPPLVQFVALALSMVVVGPQLQFRPQLSTFVLLAALMWMLARDAYRRAGRLWLAIPMLALWANLHGGFIIGLAALGTYSAVSALQDIVAARGMKRAVELSLITVAAMLATLTTPFGLATWTTVAHSLLDSYARMAITEWRPLLPMIVRRWREGLVWPPIWEIGLLLMAVTGLSWIVTIGATDLPLVAVAAVMDASALLSARNLALAVIAGVIPLAHHMTLAVHRGRPQFGAQAMRRLPWPAEAVVAAMSVLVLLRSGLLSAELRPDLRYPSGACAFMQQHGIKGNILNEYNWGEYLIWHVEPQSKIFIDSRCETAYPDAILERYFAFRYNLPGGAQVLDQFPPDLVLIKPASEARTLMDARKDWTPIYSDDVAMLYVRTDSAAAHLPGVSVRGVAPAPTFP